MEPAFVRVGDAMRHALSIPPDSEVATWSRPDEKALPEAIRARYQDRIRALEAVIKGSTLQEAAKLYGVDRNLLAKMVETASKLDAAGKPFGFRVCVPWTRHGPATPRGTEAPLTAAPHALTQLFRAVPTLGQLVEQFRGELPRRNRRSRQFELLFADFKRALHAANLDHAYPLNRPDRGRRSLLEWFKRDRRRELEQEIAAPTDDAASVTRLDQMFALQPLDRAEFDEHSIDVKWHGLVPTPKGLWCSVPLSGLWIVAMVDAVLPICYSWTLAVGRSFTYQDVLRTQAKALETWQPRKLIVPGLEYAPNAWMPNAAPNSDVVFRTASVAMDNHASHVGKATTNTLRDFQTGVINHGYSGVPEGRAHIESFFAYLEENCLRLIAGGFRPAKALTDEPTQTTSLRPEDYPIDVVALEDVLDVHISRFHVTPRDSFQDQSARDVFEAQIASGLWVTQSRLTANDAADLVVEHLFVTIRGNKKTNDLPHANFLDGVYRSPKLDQRWSLVGSRFRASVPFNDASKMTLYDSHGNVFVVLRARSPWSRSHSLEERRRARQWLKRGVFRVDEEGDAVGAYHRCVRDLASKVQWAADLFVKGHGGSAAEHVTERPTKRSSALPPDTMQGMAPRGGHVGLIKRASGK
jgi:hypothetical protein